MNGTSLRQLWNRRWLRYTVLGIALAYGGYLLLGNLVLNTGLGERIVNRKPERFQLQWTSGYTLLPFRAHLNDVQATGQFRRQHWQVQAERAEGAISVLGLLDKHIDLSGLRAEGVSVQLLPATTDLAPVPHVEGGWKVRLLDVVAGNVNRLQAGRLRLAGKGTLQGGFEKRFKGGALTVAPSRFSMQSAVLQRDGKTVLDDATLELDFSLDRTVLAETRGLHTLGNVVTHMQAKGRTVGLRILTHDDRLPDIEPVPGEGRLDLDMRLVRGQFQPGGKLALAVPWHGTDSFGVTHDNQLAVDVSVQDGLRVKASLPKVEDARLYLDADLALATNRIPLDGRFAALVPLTSGKLQGSWRFASLRWLDEMFVAAPWLAFDGAGQVDADLVLQDGKPATGSRIDVPDVGIKAMVMGNQVSGRAKAQVTLDRDGDGEPLTRLAVRMNDYAMHAGDASAPVYARGNDMAITVTAGGKVREFKDNFKAHMVFNDAQVPDLRVYNRYLPQKHLRFTSGAGRMAGDFTLDGDGGIGQGVLKLDGRQAGLVLAGLAVRGDVALGTRLQRADLKNRQFVLDGTQVAIRQASFSEAGGERHTGWWATVAMPKAQMGWNKPLSLTGSADIRMKDVSFVLALFSDKRDFPRWIDKLIDAGQAQVSGQIRWDGDTLVMAPLHGNNQRFGLDAQLKLSGGDRRGRLYASWGALGVGVEMHNQQRKFHLVRAKHWYDSQPPL